MMFVFQPRESRERITRETEATLDRWRATASTRDPNILLEAILAIGRRRTYGLPCARWRRDARSLTEDGLAAHVQAIENLLKECSERLSPRTGQYLAALVLVNDAPSVGAENDFHALRLLHDRMSLLFGVQALEWIFAQRPPAGGVDGVESSKPGAEQRYGSLASRINAYDMALREKTLSSEIYLAAEGSSLATMRAFIPSSHILPWWLDGTLEALCLARKGSTPSWQHLSGIYQQHGFGRAYREALLETIDGPGVEVLRQAQPSGRGSNWTDRYEWRAPDCDARIQLLVMYAGGGTPTLEFRINDGHNCDIGASFVGTMMFLNGLPVRWVWQRNKGVVAKAKPSEFPTTGTLVLVDCRAYKVLVPTGLAEREFGWSGEAR